MILTITPNPTIDRVLFVRDFQMQDVVRAEREVVSPSGKGVDVSIICHEFGVPTLALGLNAGYSGQMLVALLDAQGVPHDFTAAEGETRTAALITDVAAGRQSTILAHTLTAAAEHLEQLVQQVDRYAPQVQGLVCAGSLPPGLQRDGYAHLLSAAHHHGLLTLLDSSGDSLQQAVIAVPSFLKINARELADLAPEAVAKWQEMDRAPDASEIPSDLRWLADFLTTKLRIWAGQAFVITLGQRGLLAVTDEGNFYAPALDVPVVSAAGAGDAVAAGLMMARCAGQDWRAALALAVATSAAVVMNEGTAVCTKAQAEGLRPQVKVYGF